MARQLIDFEDDASARWPWWVGVVGGTVVGGAAAWLALQGAVSATDRQSVRDLVGLKPDSWLCGGASKFVRVGTFLCTGYAFRRSSDHVSRIVLITSDGTDYADDTAASSSTLCLQALWTGATAGLWAGLVSAGTSVAVVAAPSLFHKVYAAVRGKLSGRAAEVGDSHGVVVLSAAKKKARQRFLDAVSNAAATTAASTATVGAGITPAIASTVLTALAKLLRLGVPASVKNPPLTGPVPNWLSPKAQTALASLCAVAAYEPLTDRLQFIQNGIADVNTTSQPPFVARALGLSYVSTVKLTRRYTAPSAAESGSPAVNLAVVSFRGSLAILKPWAHLMDWRGTNFLFGGTSVKRVGANTPLNNNNIMVHAGYMKRASQALVDGVFQAMKDRDVIVCGHSLGGATAEMFGYMSGMLRIAATDNSNSSPEPRSMRVIALAAPFVGDISYRNMWKTNATDESLLHYVNKGDPVPLWPRHPKWGPISNTYFKTVTGNLWLSDWDPVKAGSLYKIIASTANGAAAQVEQVQAADDGSDVLEAVQDYSTAWYRDNMFQVGWLQSNHDSAIYKKELLSWACS